MQVQLADSSIRHPEGIVESLLVNVKALTSLQISWSLTCKMMEGCHSSSSDHSSAILRKESMLGPEGSDSALGEGTSCSDFNKRKSSAIQCIMIIEQLGGGMETITPAKTASDCTS
jgi:hypothetical protein